MSSARPALEAAPIPVIDAHCHLERHTFGDQLPAVMQRARDAQVVGFVAVGASGVVRGSDEAVALACAHDDVVAAVGIHPHEAEQATPEAMAHIERHLAHPRVRALGEVGLDYFYDNAPRQQQRKVFAEFIRMATRCNQPLMLHIRDAHDDCLAMFDELGVPPLGSMVHCFTAGPKEAQAYLARGLVLSIPGVVTFKNAGPLREALAEIPHDRLMVETDTPYLAPIPKRGQPNEPAFIQHTLACVAKELGVEPAVLGRQVLATTRKFFRWDPS